MNLFCINCNSDLLHYHILEDQDISPMKNKSKIIYPRCSVCYRPIKKFDVAEHIEKSRKVLLITGTAGTGKTALGQMIENRHGYVFIDGDSIQKRENYYAKLNPAYVADYQGETINTMLILLALGYNVVVGYIINHETLTRYTDELSTYGIVPIFRVLVPERPVCLERDVGRECWTAGEKWVDMWYEEMRSYLTTRTSFCIDSSNETLEETYQNHFKKLLNSD